MDTHDVLRSLSIPYRRRRLTLADAANLAWKKAEDDWRASDDPDRYDPVWSIAGATAYLLDVINDIRTRLKLPPDTPVSDIITAYSEAPVDAFPARKQDEWSLTLRQVADVMAVAKEKEVA